MRDADKAYQAAKRLIAKAKKSGTDRLSFDTPATQFPKVCFILPFFQMRSRCIEGPPLPGYESVACRAKLSHR